MLSDIGFGHYFQSFWLGAITKEGDEGGVAHYGLEFGLAICHCP